VLLFLLFYYFNWKKALFYLLITALLIAFTDQFVNLIKNNVQRLRPCNDPNLKDIIHILKHSGGYSFVSGHSTNSFAVSTFMILVLKKVFKPIYLILIWPILFAYSRIYVGVHYPVDIIFGMLLGISIGVAFFKISEKIRQKRKGIK
jgi:undecaprenyl-diphosphatase